METLQIPEDKLFSYYERIEDALKKKEFFFYEPSSDFKSSDRISVNKEAKKMLDFVGLNHCIAVITYTKTKKNEGGNIELNSSNEVFIEISDDMIYSNNRVLAVMAHEICHKVLYFNGLYYKDPIPQIENEILTDLTTVYVGFGKLSLNGCFNEYEYKIESSNYVTTCKNTETTGYLTLNTFALAYNIVCSRFNVIPDQTGLSKFAINAVQSNPFYSIAITSSVLKDLLKEKQTDDAEEMKLIVLLEESLAKLKSNLHNRHKEYYNDFIKPFVYSNEEIKGNMFKALWVHSKYSNGTLDYRLLDRIDYLNNMLNLMKEVDISINQDVTLNIECPQCGYKKRNALKEHKDIFLKCPNCGYYFQWNGSLINEKENLTINNKSSFFIRIKSFFKNVLYKYKYYMKYGRGQY